MNKCYIKYPRTPHLPWSPGFTEDDIHSCGNIFQNKQIVVLEKLDGENTSCYADGYLHARSIDSQSHISRDWIKTNIAPQIKNGLPDGWRVCGENMYAKHSIYYTRLQTYFYVFAIYNENNFCLSWQETEEWCELLGLKTVPVLFSGEYNEAEIRGLWKGKSAVGEEGEGYVIRNAEGFFWQDFQLNVAKYVREKHVQTNNHWKSQSIIPNRLKRSETS